jgi:hypothetical protein
MRLATAAFALLLNTAACAAEIEGINVPENVRLDADGPALVLNGAGVRVRLIFKVYVAALYLPAKVSNGETIIGGNQPVRFVMHLLRNLSGETINSSINDALRETLTPEQRKPLDERMARFDAIFTTLRELSEGTRITLDYLPSTGTTIRVDADEKGRIPGADFVQALLRVWLGDRARDPDLRKALLGVGSK